MFSQVSPIRYRPAVVAAPVCMCVCVFADCPEVTPDSLRHLSSVTELWSLTLTGVPASDIRGQEGAGSWIRELPDPLLRLAICGELWRHTHFRVCR